MKSENRTKRLKVAYNEKLGVSTRWQTLSVAWSRTMAIKVSLSFNFVVVFSSIYILIPLTTAKLIGDFLNNRRCIANMSVFKFLPNNATVLSAQGTILRQFRQCAALYCVTHSKIFAESKPFRSASPIGALWCVVSPIYWRRCNYF
jgi:hypothetical protein